MFWTSFLDDFVNGMLDVIFYFFSSDSFLFSIVLGVFLFSFAFALVFKLMHYFMR